ncbi:MAG: hypothetical protein HW418_3547 [Anaerolineales bacterium]|nr:hypothetical protein [Anaerolineales bacterium]
MRSLQSHFNEKALAAGGVRVSVCEEAGPCPVCAGPMIVQKTVSRPVQTLEHGHFLLREVVHECAAGCRRPDGSLVMRRASESAERLLPGRSVGYDVMVFIGRRRFLDNRQREEIRAELKSDYGISLSTGEISALARLFLNYVRRLHEACAPRLRRALAQDGGWPMHADATCEDGRGTMLVILAGWRRWVLGSWKIPTENAEAILACARLTVQRFGEPCAVMRDLGRAMISACEDLVAGLSATIKVLGCHSHFLADVGRDLLKPGHDALRDALRRLKMRGALRTFASDMGRELGGKLETAREGFRNWQQQEPESHDLPAGDGGVAVVRGLAQWAFDYAAAQMSRNFPFDRPYLDLYDRCVRARRVVDGWLRTPPLDRRVLRVLRRLGRTLDPLRQEGDLVRVARDLRVRVNLFDELRETLRLSPGSYGRSQPWSKRPMTLRQARKELRDVRAALARFAASLRKRRPQRGPAQDLREAIDVILDHLKRHGKSLWGHEVCLPAKAGGGVRLIERTNNLCEHFFHAIKHGERRRSGRKNLARDFELLPPESALVQNFNHPDYVAIVCGSLERLPRVFAEMDAAERRKRPRRPEAAQREVPVPQPSIETGSLPLIDRRLIRSEDMLRRIDAVVRSRPPRIMISGRFGASATV